ncbi:phage tail tape measure protein [Kribbella sp. CA-293567]|uniref:phage tail tape measure protein n=1 Tax=Kribbella sp. CA-293567 TaxID=3002436 RepID=UPI0022DD409E|nr:phage tail tape measure protein [Kribbella sp. CA-293567]WBQ03027.1 phage tail tape measure protein [Kribbella sp. CA-293567]
MTDRTVSVGLQLKLGQWSAQLRTAVAQGKKAIGDITDEAHKNRGSLDDMARGFAGVGTAATAVGVIAVQRFAAFDKAMSSVKASTRENTIGMAKLRDAALDAGAKTKFSATEAAQGIENLAKAGVSTTDILNGGLNGALDLAAAGELAVADAGEIAATAMTQFKLKGKDVPHIADLLAAAAGKAQGEVSDMAQALNQSGLVASQFNLSIEETTGTLAAFAAQGLIGSDAGTSFKTMLLQLANPSKESRRLMDELGISAYDAQGAFVGIGPLAEQLKTKLSGLTQQQRDQALATIFGSDAIRAANVLYTNGAKGIADWTGKVDDAGFASETAATKTDNLSGDIERLGGALDTALIKSGSGANDVLRGLAQGADAAVTGFAGLPDEVQAVAAGLTAVLAVGGLSAAGLLKAASAAGEARESWSALGRTGKTLTLSMGAVGVVLTGAVALYSVFAKRNADAAAKVKDLSGTLDEQTGAITKSTRSYVAAELAQSGLAKKAKDLGLDLSKITDAALGNDQAMKDVVGSLDAVIRANTQVGNSYTGNNKTLSATGLAAKQLKEELVGTNGALTKAQQEHKLTAEGAKVNKESIDGVAAANKKAAEDVKAAAKAFDKEAESITKANNAMLDSRGLLRDFQAALADARESLKENGRSLDITTEKGRKNQEALDGVADAGLAVVESMREQGKAQPQIQAAFTSQREQLLQVATRFYGSKAAAEAYVEAVFSIPKSSTTAVRADTKDIDAKLARARAQLNDKNLTKERRAKLTAEIAQLLAAKKQAQAAIDSLRGKNVDITVTTYKNMIENFVPAKTKGVEIARASGGILPGEPSGVDNMVIAAASGEFVINARQTKKHRAQLEAINAGLDGYATGGLVGGNRLVDVNYLLGQLAKQFNPLEGVNFSATLKNQTNTRSAAASAQRTAARANTVEANAKAEVARGLAAEKQQRARIARLRSEKASTKTIADANRELERRIAATNKAKAAAVAATKASEKADAVYKAKLDAATRANEAHQRSIEAIVAAQKDAVALADQISTGLKSGSGLADLFGMSGTGKGLLGDLQAQGKELAAFRGQIERLRKAGLSETLIGQIVSSGADAGSEIAQAILSGGLGLVASLNAAQKALEAQANLIGAGSATAQYGGKNILTGRADGGSVQAYKDYWVGERGPEILRMGGRPGRVEPNHVVDPDRYFAGNRFSGHGAGGQPVVEKQVILQQTFTGTDYRTADVIGHRTLAAARFAGKA